MSGLIANNAGGTLASGITAAATSVTLSAGQGVLFPALTAPDWFPATIFNAGGTFEIVKVTGRTADTLTIVRAQEGTAASAFLTADKIDLRMTAAVIANKLDKDTGGTVSGPVTFGSTLAVGGACAVTGGLMVGGSASVAGTFMAGGAVTATGTTTINGAAGTFRGLIYATAGSSRWSPVVGNDPETGANAGSNFALSAYSDTGAFLDNPIFITRANSQVNFSKLPMVGGIILGYLGIPQNIRAGGLFTAAAGSEAEEEFFTANGSLLLPANAAVPFPIGTFKVITADAGVTVFLGINSDTLRWPGGGNLTGTRTITGPGLAVVSKKKATEWWIVGGQGVS